MDGFNQDKTVGASEDFNNKNNSGGGFTDANVDEKPKTGGSQNPMYDAGTWKSLFQFLGENLSFTFMFISLIGYIFISSFGNMKTGEDFFRYVMFILLCIIGYRVYIYLKEIDFASFKFRSLKNLIILVLFLFICWSYRLFIMKNINDFYNYAKEVFVSSSKQMDEK